MILFTSFCLEANPSLPVKPLIKTETFSKSRSFEAFFGLSVSSEFALSPVFSLLGESSGFSDILLEPASVNSKASFGTTLDSLIGLPLTSWLAVVLYTFAFSSAFSEAAERLSVELSLPLLIIIVSDCHLVVLAI